MTRRTFLAGLIGVVLGVLAFSAGWLAGRTGIGSAVPLESLDAREHAFVDRMKGVVLDGVFTVDGRTGTPRPDRYEITSVERSATISGASTPAWCTTPPT